MNTISTTDALLRALADVYIDAPYRMDHLLSRDRFAQHLSIRGLATPQANLQELAQHGLLLPFLHIKRHVRRNPLGLAQGRLAWYRAKNLIIYPSLLNPGVGSLNDGAIDADDWVIDSYYHPYQTMWAREVYEASRRSLPPGAEWYWNDVNTDAEWGQALSDRYRTFVEATTDPSSPPESYRRLLLLLLLDARYLPSIRQDWPRDLDAWTEWRKGINPVNLVDQCGFDVTDLKRWRSDILAHAVIRDPLREWYLLIRHISYEKRQSLRGEARLAQDIYEQCELLRSIVYDVSGEVLPEEDDVPGLRPPGWKQTWFGVDDLTFRDRGVLRRVIDTYGLNPDWNLYWVVEGTTEYDFITRILTRGLGVDLDEYGLRLINAGGINNIVKLKEMLLDARNREVFVMVTADADEQAQDVLNKLLADDLATAGYHTWFLNGEKAVDFERANFTDEELADAARAYAARLGHGLDLSAQEITDYRSAKIALGKPMPSGKILENLCRQKGITRYSKQELGKDLADQLLESATFGEKALRPIERVIGHAMHVAKFPYRQDTVKTFSGLIGVEVFDFSNQ